jgi:opacity protein-like surface antigen
MQASWNASQVRKKLKKTSRTLSTTLSVLALLGACSFAEAADLKSPPPVASDPVPAPEIFTWDRFYVGANLGGGFGDGAGSVSGFGTDGALAPNFAWTFPGHRPGGVIGGLQAGHNWRFDDVVVGFEADAQAAGLSGGLGLPFLALHQTVEWFATLRGRVGYLVRPDLLAYGTGGFASGSGSSRFSFVDGAGNSGEGLTNPTRTGFAAGGGLEWAFAPDWSAKLEYLFIDLGRNRGQGFNLVDPDGNGVANGATLSGVANRFHVVRAGVNFHFTPNGPDPAGLLPPLFVRDASSDKFHEIETHYIFGFTEGADIDAEGEKELEFITMLDAGRRRRPVALEDPQDVAALAQGRVDGSYRAITQKVEFEHTLTQNLQYSLGITGASHQIRGVEGLDNLTNINLRGLSGEMRYVLLGRGPASPIGVTLQVEPEYGHVSGTSGQSETAIELETKLIVDTEIIQNRLYAGVNFVYEPEISRGVGENNWARESTLGVTGAFTWRLTPQIALGGDLQYYRHHAANFAFDQVDGQALFAGPHLFIRVDKKIFVRTAFATQVRGHAAGELHGADLTNFSRYKALLQFGVEF